MSRRQRGNFPTQWIIFFFIMMFFMGGFRIFGDILGFLIPMMIFGAIMWSIARSMGWVNANQQAEVQEQLRQAGSQIRDAFEGATSHSSMPDVQRPPRRAATTTAPNTSDQSPQRIAEQAMRRAGASSGRLIGLRDIGILAYDDQQKPTIHRLDRVAAEANYIRPFIVIHLNEVENAHGNVTFELVDHEGKTRFSSTQRYGLHGGDNLITPTNWLRMGDSEVGGDWTMRVKIGQENLAEHGFIIAPDQGVSVGQFIQADGEIPAWLNEAVNTNASSGMSLDELLEGQDDLDLDEEILRESQKQRQIGQRPQ